MKYSIDTSALLDAWVRYYAPDIIPGLWKKLEEMIENGDLLASEEVFIELEKKNDDLYQWAKEHSKMIIPSDEKIQIAVADILKNHRKLIDERRNRSGADPFVIALALVENCKVITGEHKSNSEKRPHIPDVCDKLGVKWLNITQLCREQKWSFA